MKEVAEQLKSSADLVIYDSSPLLSVTDAMLVAPLVDSVILVLEAGRTGRDEVRRGAEALRRANSQAHFGTVLNKVTARERNYYYYSSNDSIGRQHHERSRVLSKIFGKWKRSSDTGRAKRGIVGRMLSRVRGQGEGVGRQRR